MGWDQMATALHDALFPSDLAESVTHESQGVPPVQTAGLVGIYSREYVEVLMMGGPPVSSSRPLLSVRKSASQPLVGDILVGDRFLIRATWHRVREIRPDGEGLNEYLLEPLS